MPAPGSTTLAEMQQHVARFKELRGSEDAYVDSRLPGSRRRKINVIGMGVVENAANPDLLPNIPLAAHGFNLGMIQCDHGEGTKLHSHTTEEVFMPLVGPWAVTFQTDEGQQELVLEPFDSIHVPKGVFRGFRYVGSGKGTLLTIIGGPDCGKVEWAPGVLEAARATGLGRDAKGDLVTA